jgi:hypothetical protein
MTIHTPFESPFRDYKKLVIFGNDYSDYWSMNLKIGPDT